MQEIEKLKEKYFKKINEFLFKIETSFHSELFSEEFDEIYDSTLDAGDRKNGKNPMNKSYIERINKKRKILGISKLGKNGLPTDYSSNLYIKKIMLEYIKKRVHSNDLNQIKKSNISSFFKKTKKY